MLYYTKHVFICSNKKASGKKCCADTERECFLDYMKGTLLELNVYGPEKIRISKSGCLGRCSSGPCMVIYPEGIWYTYTSCADLDEIINSHLLNSTIVNRLLIEV